MFQATGPGRAGLGKRVRGSAGDSGRGIDGAGMPVSFLSSASDPMPQFGLALASASGSAGSDVVSLEGAASSDLDGLSVILRTG